MKPFYILIGALVVVAVLVLIFIGIFKPGNKPATTATAKSVVLANHAAEDISVSYKLDGITRGNEMHRAIKITVTKNSRMLEVISGYQGAVILSKSFTNNTESYKAFLAGLQTVGFIKQSTTVTSQNFEGQCPLGFRYIFTTQGIKDAPKMLWSTSCANPSGTFRGNLNSVQQLFKNQIPGYYELVDDVNL